MIRLSEQIWDINPPFRTHAEWANILEVLRNALSNYIKLPVEIVDHWINNDEDESSWSICSRIKIPVSEVLGTYFVGSLCMTLNREKAVRISTELLLFAKETRHAAHQLGSEKGKDLIILNFRPHPKSIGRWQQPFLEGDAYGGWEAFQQTENLDERY